MLMDVSFPNADSLKKFRAIQGNEDIFITSKQCWDASTNSLQA